MWSPKVGVVNGNPQSVKFISAKILSFENLVLYGRYTVGNLLCRETTFRGNSVAECTRYWCHGGLGVHQTVFMRIITHLTTTINEANC